MGQDEAESRGRDRWDENATRVSRAFNDWYWTDHDQRAFLYLALEFARDGYARTWDRAHRAPIDPEDPWEPSNTFEYLVSGIYERDFEWSLCVAVLLNGVTAYEVYLEKAREDVRERYGHPRVVPERSPEWWRLRDFFRSLGVEAETPEVLGVRELRHLLAHRRGELRTEQQRQRFASEANEPWSQLITLTVDDAIGALDVLAATVRAIDPAVWAHSFGHEHDPALGR